MQCPNCKYYKVNVDRRERTVGRVPNPDIPYAIAAVVVGAIAWSVGNGILNNVATTFPGIANKILILKVIFPIGCLFICTKAVVTALKRSRPITETDYSNYECRNCGYTWNDRR